MASLEALGTLGMLFLNKGRWCVYYNGGVSGWLEHSLARAISSRSDGFSHMWSSDKDFLNWISPTAEEDTYSFPLEFFEVSNG